MCEASNCPLGKLYE